jgi:hypothetical protein
MAEERTLGQLVADASQDLSELIRYEIALAKAELTDDLKRGGIAGGLFGVAGFLGLLSLVTLLIAAAYGLVAAGLSPWLSFLIVTAALLLLAAIAVLIGIRQIKKIEPPERAVREAKLTIAAVKGNRNGAAGS